MADHCGPESPSKWRSMFCAVTAACSPGILTAPPFPFTPPPAGFLSSTDNLCADEVLEAILARSLTTLWAKPVSKISPKSNRIPFHIWVLPFLYCVEVHSEAPTAPWFAAFYNIKLNSMLPNPSAAVHGVLIDVQSLFTPCIPHQWLQSN